MLNFLFQKFDVVAYMGDLFILLEIFVFLIILLKRFICSDIFFFNNHEFFIKKKKREISSTTRLLGSLLRTSLQKVTEEGLKYKIGASAFLWLESKYHRSKLFLQGYFSPLNKVIFIYFLSLKKLEKT